MRVLVNLCQASIFKQVDMDWRATMAAALESSGPEFGIQLDGLMLKGLTFTWVLIKKSFTWRAIWSENH